MPLISHQGAAWSSGFLCPYVKPPRLNELISVIEKINFG